MPVIIIPENRMGKNILISENPDACMASISLSELKRPTAISAPTRLAKGKEKLTMEGREKKISLRTWPKGTLFERISSAIRIIWLTKKMKKKKRKATKNEKRYSAVTYR
jgi:hypothetical protein